jgi:hypothetical protein
MLLSMHQLPPTLPRKPLCIFTLGGRVSCYFKSPETVVQVANGSSQRNNNSFTNVHGDLTQAVLPRNWIREMRVSNLKGDAVYSDWGTPGFPAPLAKHRVITSRWCTTPSFHIVYNLLNIHHSTLFIWVSKMVDKCTMSKYEGCW